jgi:hypothetical protein
MGQYIPCINPIKAWLKHFSTLVDLYGGKQNNGQTYPWVVPLGMSHPKFLWPI